jgi:hypothetical protein
VIILQIDVDGVLAVMAGLPGAWQHRNAPYDTSAGRATVGPTKHTSLEFRGPICRQLQQIGERLTIDFTQLIIGAEPQAWDGQ